MDGEIILKVEGVTKEYGSLKAVDNVSFSIGSGKIVGLLGPNGAGKTTTINMILGILEPTQGSIEIFGKNLKEDRSRICKNTNFAAVYAHMPANLTVRQNLYVFGLLYEVKGLKERIKLILQEFDLERFCDTKAGLLSSGEASRLNIAKAIMNNPRLLLLDEPTASLDPAISQLVRLRIKQYVEKSKTAILWTSHNMQEIQAVCDQVLFLSHGKILLSGNPKTLPKEYGKKDLDELFISIAREPLSFGS
jgi:ABC-2 type transport system ATP-binding protein